MNRLENAPSIQEPLAPMLFVLDDSPAERAKAEAWEAEWGETARRQVAEGRLRYAGVDFRPPSGDTAEAEEML